MIADTITVPAANAVRLLVPGPQMAAGYIQNSSTTYHMRVSLDGVSVPTASKGMLVYAGTQLWLPDYIKNAVLAIGVGGDATAEVGTDDLTSTAPGTAV